ncbi:hypothetical protein OG520_39875 (plasmid) [Streptomyces sp. NBC_00984]|uniref:hypothetical protein n=1 Tax=Streptomyces sp. NBC_00984 TaxID=2903700 RepID=UPI002F9112AD|nr:hypothetical protein OG520_39875 [Streptomyces sp. NBC_00984]
MSTNDRRARSLWGALAAGLLVLTVGAPASADSGPSDGPGEATISAGDLGPDHLVTCSINAAKPNYSGTTVTAVGYMSSCTPSTPETCRTETDLLRYYPGPGTWEVLASGPVNYSCPPPNRTSTAVLQNCKPASVNWTYMTRTSGTIIHDGKPTAGHVDSSLLNVKCV